MSEVQRALAARRKKREPTFWERVQAGADNVVRGGKQVVAGALETTIAPTGPNSNVPAIVHAIPGTVGLVATLMGRKAPTVMGVDTGASLDKLGYAARHTNKYLGTTDPRNTLEQALRIGGALAVPGPKGGVIRKAAPTASRGEKITRAVGRGVTEVAVPLRQTGAKGAAAVTGVLTGVREGVEAVAPSNEYTSVAEAVGGTTPEPIAMSDEDFEKFILAPDDTTDDPDAAFEAMLNAPVTDDTEVDEVEKAEWGNTVLAAGATLAAAFGGYKVAKVARDTINTRLADAVNDTPQFIGKTVKRSRGGVLDKFVTAVSQQDQPVRNAANDFLTPQQAKQYGYKSDLASNVSIGARVSHQFRTGRMVGVPPLPNGKVRRTIPLAPLANAFAKELSLDEQKLVGDALLAASALDDFRNTGVLSALNKDINGNAVSPRDLDDMVRSARSNPKYGKYMDDIQKSFADLLEYRVARGTMSREAADEMRKKRPNYVVMNRDLDTDVGGRDPMPYNANHDKGGGLARATEELSGVQGGRVGNPINSLFDEWAGEIRRAEVNDLRATFLQQMDSVGGTGVSGGRLVYRLPNGVKPNTDEGIHRVWENGREAFYRVDDPAISKALEYAPRATIGALENLRQVSQSFTTGPIGSLFNLFAVTKSTLYDTTLGTLLRPENVKLGNINELLGNINPSLSIGRADPTAYLGAFTGAARYMWDDMRGAMAQNLTDQLMRDVTPLRKVVGDANVTAFRDKLAASYEASVKSFMDEHGMTSLTMHGTPDPSRILTGVEQMAPKFSTDTAQHLYNEVRRNGPGVLEGTLAAGANQYAKLKATSIARAYGGVLEAFHNGFRYSAVAANRSRNKNVEQLSSQMRRLSADAAQHGGSDAVNKTLGSLMYGNLAVQTLHQAATMIRANPASFIANLGAIGATAAALHYTALATDEEARERHKLKSAAQKASSITTFGGAEIPIDPLLRIPIGNVFTVLDHATGAHNGEWDGNFMKAFDSLIQGDFATEEYQQDAGEVLWQTAKANNPFTPEALPALNAGLAYAGVDTGMSRITGETTPVRTQKLSGLDEDASQVDGLGSAYAANIVATLFGSAGQNFYQIANDASRAYGDTNDVGKAVEQGLARYKDIGVKGTGAFKPMLFGNYEQVHSVTDTNSQLMRARGEGIERAVNILNKDFKGAGVTSLQGTALGMEIEAQTPPPELQGTQLLTVVTVGSQLSKDLTGYKQRLSAIGKQVEAVRNGYTTSPEEKNTQINDLNEERRYLNWQMLNMSRKYEKVIQDKIGDPDFRFDDFDPEAYMKPIPPAQ